jgi:CHAD domain-containing protein
MSSEAVPSADGRDATGEGPFFRGPTRHDVGLYVADGLPGPSVAMVLHRVLARSARTFLLNDMSSELAERTKRHQKGGSPVSAGYPDLAPDRPLWAHTATERTDRAARRSTEIERIHQSRVALRRIRSNLRTFRLAVDPAWGTALRAELAWYAGRLGESRDLHIIEDMIREKGPQVTSPANVERLELVVNTRRSTVLAELDAERGGARRFQLTEQMMVLWDGPNFSPKADMPAAEALPTMVRRAWHDLRGAARAARKKPTDENLHKLRIRLKDLRYGCETVALAEGGPARKTAKAAEQLQGQLGELHDARFSIDWLRDLGSSQPELSEPVEALVAVQREAAAEARTGWKPELKEVERLWRSWQT